jgi:hypothetical protein
VSDVAVVRAVARVSSTFGSPSLMICDSRYDRMQLEPSEAVYAMTANGVKPGDTVPRPWCSTRMDLARSVLQMIFAELAASVKTKARVRSLPELQNIDLPIMVMDSEKLQGSSWKRFRL